LRRHDTKYARVRRGNRFMVIVGSSKPICHLPFFVEQISVEYAAGKFATWVDAIKDSKGGNPISTCRAWAMPAREHSDWDLIAVGPAPKAVRSAAFLVVMDCAERSIGGMQVTVCRGDTLQVDRLCELIGSLASGNPIKGKCECKEESASGAVWSMDQDVDGRRYLIGAVT